MGVLRITLASDACVASGKTFNTFLDSDVCYDRYGFPFIPGTRIKGCLRDVGRELADWGISIPDAALFGSANRPGTPRAARTGAFSVSDARLQGYESLCDALDQLDDARIGSRRVVLARFTKVRSLAGERGFSRVRVLNKGLVFLAELQVEPEYREAIEACIAGWRAIGKKRSRGLGEIEASVDWNESLTAVADGFHAGWKAGEWSDKSPGESSALLSYTLQTRTPLCLPCNGRVGDASQTYIAGGKLLGHIARRCGEGFRAFKDQGPLRCSNAYLSGNGRRSTPVPACYFVEKADETALRDRLSAGKRSDDDDQLSSIGDGYVYGDSDTEVSIVYVDTQTHYHHRLSSPDKRAARMHSVNAIEPGQQFKGTIEGTPEQIRHIHQLLIEAPVFHLGSYRNTGYGEVLLRVDSLSRRAPAAENRWSSFDVVLASPAILQNSNGMYSCNKGDLLDEIEAILHAEDELRITGCFQKITTLERYSATWRESRPTIKCLDKGSTFRVETTSGAAVDIAPLERAWVGSSNAEGFGELLVRRSRNAYYRRKLEGSKDAPTMRTLVAPDQEQCGAQLVAELRNAIVANAVEGIAIVDSHERFELEKTRRADKSERDQIPTEVIQFLKERYKATMDNLSLYSIYTTTLLKETRVLRKRERSREAQD